ncbi:MAG: hypothetical protein IPK19_31360 [Chloroflexi bacterium]|nr:hypothetical protein [Chloroflexota bacterium]
MTWQETPLTAPMLLIAAIVTLLAVYIWLAPGTPITRHAALLLFGGVFWLVMVTLELAGGDLDTKLFWNKLQYFGSVTVPVGWLLLTFRIQGRSEWNRPNRIVGLSIIPALTLVAVLTNEWHGLAMVKSRTARKWIFLCPDQWSRHHILDILSLRFPYCYLRYSFAPAVCRAWAGHV